MSVAERDELTGQIRSALTARAFEFVSSLQQGFVRTEPGDLDRLVRVMEATSRQPPTDKRDSLMQDFLIAIHSDLKEKAACVEFADDSTLDAHRELNAKALVSQETPPTG